MKSNNDQNSLRDDTSLWVESKNVVIFWIIWENSNFFFLLNNFQDNYDDSKSDITQSSQLNDGKFSLLQFALFNFRESLNKWVFPFFPSIVLIIWLNWRYDLRSKDGSIRGSVKLIENIKSKKKSKKGKGTDSSEWTWSEISSLVKYSRVSPHKLN